MVKFAPLSVPRNEKVQQAGLRELHTAEAARHGYVGEEEVRRYAVKELEVDRAGSGWMLYE